MLHAAVVVFQLQRTLGRSIGARCRYEKPPTRGAQTTFVTLFAFRQDEHTRARRTPPPTRTFIECRFGRQRRFVLRWEWLTENPVDGPLPQTSHLAAITGQR